MIILFRTSFQSIHKSLENQDWGMKSKKSKTIFTIDRFLHNKGYIFWPWGFLKCCYITILLYLTWCKMLWKWSPTFFGMNFAYSSAQIIMMMWGFEFSVTWDFKEMILWPSNMEFSTLLKNHASPPFRCASEFLGTSNKLRCNNERIQSMDVWNVFH